MNFKFRTSRNRNRINLRYSLDYRSIGLNIQKRALCEEKFLERKQGEIKNFNSFTLASRNHSSKIYRVDYK